MVAEEARKDRAWRRAIASLQAQPLGAELGLRLPDVALRVARVVPLSHEERRVTAC
jgi:hypothetical protein